MDRENRGDNPMADLIEELRQHYLFASLDETQRRGVKAHSRRRTLASGERLFAQGEAANRFWWLESGQVKLYRLSRDGHEKVMGIVAPGQSFAEGILFMDEPRYPVNAESVTASTVIGFEREAYLAILENSFPACRALLRQMVRRIRHHLDEIEALTIQNARYRLAHFLLRLHRSEENEEVVTLPARKHLIAARLAMQPETLSRLFNELEKSGVIRVRGSRVEIRDREALRSLLE